MGKARTKPEIGAAAFDGEAVRRGAGAIFRNECKSLEYKRSLKGPLF